MVWRGLFAGEEYNEALKKIKESHNASEKIKIVKNVLPDKLKIDGNNPLDVLYDSLSVGLHGLNNEQCLDHAGLIRETLCYLIEQIDDDKNNIKKYSIALSKLKKN